MINILLPYHDHCQQYNRFLHERAYTRNVLYSQACALFYPSRNGRHFHSVKNKCAFPWTSRNNHSHTSSGQSACSSVRGRVSAESISHTQLCEPFHTGWYSLRNSTQTQPCCHIPHTTTIYLVVVIINSEAS